MGPCSAELQSDWCSNLCPQLCAGKMGTVHCRQGWRPGVILLLLPAVWLPTGGHIRVQYAGNMSGESF